MSDGDALSWPLYQLPWVAGCAAGERVAGTDRAASRDESHRVLAIGFQGRMRLGARDVQVMAGDVAVVPGGCACAIEAFAPGRLLAVSFLPAQTSGPLIRLPGRTPAMHAIAAHQALTRLVDEHSGISGELERVRRGAALLEILCRLADSAEAATHMRHAAIEAVVDRIAQAVAVRPTEDITLAGMAAIEGVNARRLAHAFHIRLGLTFRAYQLRERIRLAQRLLLETALPVGEIGRRVGIADPHYFNKAFRAQTGMAPSAARSLRSD